MDSSYTVNLFCKVNNFLNSFFEKKIEIKVSDVNFKNSELIGSIIFETKNAEYVILLSNLN